MATRGRRDRRGRESLPEDGRIAAARARISIVDAMLKTSQSIGARRGFRIRFVVSSGDAVPVRPERDDVERELRAARRAADARGRVALLLRRPATTTPRRARLATPSASTDCGNTLAAMSKLMPPDGSPRRLAGYPTHAFGYGNAFFF